MGTKIIHVHFKQDAESEKDAYFGSVPAIYRRYSRDDLGITRQSLANTLPKNKCYENKKVIIKVSEMTHSSKKSNN